MISTNGNSRPRWLVPVFAAGLIWLCFFRLSGGLGFYDDDLHFFGNVTNYESPAELWNWVKFCWLKWPQGRPMGYTAMYSLGYLGDSLGGLNGYQFVSMLLSLANALLVHRLVARHVTERAALPAMLFFSLAAIATVQLAFTFAFYYSVAVLFFLIAANLYPGRWRPLSYLFLALAMLTQEPVTLAFLVFPLLILPANRDGVVSMIRHTLYWLLVVGAILAVRWKIGDPWGSERVGEIVGSPFATAGRSVESVIMGFGTHLKLMVLRPIQAFDGLNLPGAIAFAIAATATWLLLGWTNSGARARNAEPAPAVAYPLMRMLLVGLLCMSVPYAAYFRDYWHPCAAETGFFSAVHIVTMFGSSLVVGSIWAAAMSRPKLRKAARVAASIHFASLVLFGQVLQRDLVENWSGQKEFWQEVYRLCPDLADGTDVLVLNRNLPERRFASQFSWPDELTLGRQYRFPSSWNRPPRAFLVNPDIAGHHIKVEDGQFKWIFHPSILNHARAGLEIIEPGTVIILEKSQTGYERLFGTYPVRGGELPLKEVGPPTLPTMPRRRFAELFDIPPMIEASTQSHAQ